jgi:hypothetical protein
MNNTINILQLKMQMNMQHLIVIYQKGKNIKEYDLSLGIEESKKKISSIAETKKFLQGDQSAKPDLSLVHDNPFASAFYWREYTLEHQEKEEKEFIKDFSAKIKKLERNIERTIKLIRKYYLRTDDDMTVEFKKYIEEVVEEGGI